MMVVIAAAFTFIGCPQPPPQNAEIITGYKTSDYMEFEFSSGQLKVKVSATPGLGGLPREYEVGVSVLAEYDESLSGRLQFQPDEVQASIDGYRLDQPEVQWPEPPVKIERTSARVWIHFAEELPDSLYHTLDRWKSIIMIEFNDFMLLDGQPLHIEPVRALDPDLPERR